MASEEQDENPYLNQTLGRLEKYHLMRQAALKALEHVKDPNPTQLANQRAIKQDLVLIETAFAHLVRQN